MSIIWSGILEKSTWAEVDLSYFLNFVIDQPDLNGEQQ